MRQIVNGIHVQAMNLWLVSDHHVVIQDESVTPYRVSHVEYTGKGHMDLTVMENGDFTTLGDAIEAIQHDRAKQGLPEIRIPEPYTDNSSWEDDPRPGRG